MIDDDADEGAVEGLVDAQRNDHRAAGKSDTADDGSGEDRPRRKPRPSQGGEGEV